MGCSAGMGGGEWALWGALHSCSRLPWPPWDKTMAPILVLMKSDLHALHLSVSEGRSEESCYSIIYSTFMEHF